jgi:hypothetical protein
LRATANRPSSTIISCSTTPACISSIGHIALYNGEYDQITPLANSFLYSGYAATPGSWTSPLAAPVPGPSTMAAGSGRMG